MLGGCADSPQDSRPEAGPPRAWSEPAVIPFRCATICFEPTFALAPDGWIYAAVANLDASAGGLLRTQDLVHYEDVALPEAGRTGIGNSYFIRARGDALVQIAPGGDLVLSSLVYTPAGAASVANHGVEMLRSSDGGASWHQVLLSAVPAAGPFQVALSDRQWVAMPDATTMYVTYQQVPSGIWVARSDDAGRTWTPFVRVVGPDSRSGQLGPTGGPQAWADWVAMPFHHEQDQSGILADLGAEATRNVVELALSSDRGQTFRRQVVATMPQGAVADGFPAFARTTDGALHVAWEQAQEAVGLWYSSSPDGGESWSSPLLVADAPIARGAWLDGDGDALAMAWFEGALGEPSRPAAAVAQSTDFQRGFFDIHRWNLTFDGPGTDFPHTDLAAGAVVAGWFDETSGQVQVSVRR